MFAPNEKLLNCCVVKQAHNSLLAREQHCGNIETLPDCGATLPDLKTLLMGEQLGSNKTWGGALIFKDGYDARTWTYKMDPKEVFLPI